MSNRTHNTLQKLVQSMETAKVAYSQLKDRNQEVKTINAKLNDKNKQLADTQFKIIKFVAEVLGSHDLFTGRHVIHTQKYVEIIAAEMVKLGFYENELTQEKISLSKMTFSHQMIRLIFVEQLYRAMTILNNNPYHHE